MSFNLELFGAEQFSTMHYNELNVLLHKFSLNIDACNIGKLIAHLWELFYSSALNTSMTLLLETGVALGDLCGSLPALGSLMINSIQQWGEVTIFYSPCSVFHHETLQAVYVCVIFAFPLSFLHLSPRHNGFCTLTG